MRKLYILCVIGLAALIIGLAWADQVTLTTYYPAPYGVYKVLRLAPQASAPTSPVDGDIYFDSSLNQLRCYITASGGWRQLDNP